MRIRKAILKSTLRIINLLTIQTECYQDVPCMICRELFVIIHFICGEFVNW